jgi:Lar family restriction alleviation protein
MPTVRIADSNGRKHDLELCPFCGSDDLDIEEPSGARISSLQEPFESDVYKGFVVCYDCCASGPTDYDVLAVVNRWNDRSAH